MTDSDIVTRLRQRWLAHQDKDVRFVVVHAGEWMRCTDLTREAADEIERLREQLRLANIDNFNTTAEAERLQEERDEARRLYCKAVEEIERGMSNDSARDAAKAKGWDCYDNYTEEEVTDDGSAEF